MKKIEKETKVTLELAKKSDLPEFRRKLQEAFALAVIETFGDCDHGPIPSDRDIQESFDAPNAVIYHVLQAGRKVGGVVLRIDSETHHNSLDLFFVSPEHHSKGIGIAAWQAVEAHYLETVAWETVTPYFEKRNISFYVNKCGFHIVEFYNQYHTDPNMRQPEHEDPGTKEFFRFQKMMK